VVCYTQYERKRKKQSSKERVGGISLELARAQAPL
jgi:hypothetical protein